MPVVDFTLASMNGFKYDFPMPDSSLGESQEQGVNSGSVGYNKITSIFDVYWQEATKRYTLSYCGHGNGCNHPYTYFTNRAETGKGTSYVYKPEIPQATWDKWEEDLNNEKETLKKNYIDTDWREIIYQMAKDYRKHNHDDDFLIKVRENNILAGKYLYPTGYTGYEQYYIDLEGFWRQLYNPDFKIDDPKLGGDGPIETLIEVNDFGHFDECTDAEVYVYPYFILTNDDLSATNEDGVKLYAPDNTYVITKLEDRYDIKPFIKHDSCKLDAKVVYYKFYETNKGQATEIKFEVAEKSILSTLYIKKGEDYVRWIDEKFAEFKLTKDMQYLCAKSDTAKMVRLLDSFIKAIYVSEDGTRFYPHYYEKVMREDGTHYFAKTKIEYYFTDYNYFDEDQGERCYWNKNV